MSLVELVVSIKGIGLHEAHDDKARIVEETLVPVTAIPSSYIPVECMRCDAWFSLGNSGFDRFVSCSDPPSLCDVAGVLR